MSSLENQDAEFHCLIILLGALGDVLRGFVVPTELKSSFPRCRITWLVEPKWASLVEAHPCVDEVLVFDRPRGLSAVWELKRAFAKHTFHIALDLQRHFKSGCFSLFSGAKRRIGFHRKNCKEGNWLFNTETIPFIPESEPKLKNYLEFPKVLGAKVSENPKFGFEGQDLRQLLSEHSRAVVSKNSIALVLGSSWPSKDWLKSGYYQLTKLILERSEYEVVYVGDPGQVALANELKSTVSSHRVHDLVGKTSVVELLGVLKESRIVIGPDSGPGHMAAVVGTPYISLFGPTDPRRVAPYGGEKLVLRTQLGCMPCNRRTCPGLDRLCMRLISPEMVYSRLDEVVSSSPSVLARVY